MKNTSLKDAGLNLRYDEGSVGEFLQKGGTVGISLHNLWLFTLLFSMALAALAIVLIAYGQEIDTTLAIIAGVDFSAVQLAPWLVAACVGLALLTVVLAVVSFRSHGTARDRRRQLRAQVLSIMVKNPRFPVGMQTQISTLGLRCLYLKGDRAIECRSRYPFVAEDFVQGSMSSQAAAHSLFDAFDYEVYKGRLLVYYDKEAAEEVRERRYMKGARNHE